MTDGAARVACYCRSVLGETLLAVTESRTHTLEAGEYRVGRADDADIRFDDRKVSRSHGVLRRTPSGWVLEDTSSTGTYVDGTRTAVVHIDAAVEVRLGDPEVGPLLRLEPQTAERLQAAAEVVVPATPVRPDAPTAQKPHGVLAGRITTGDLTRIGRNDDNDIVVDDLLVSRYHAEVRRTGGTIEIVDVGSANGTFVNGNRVQRAPLEDLDVVAIGNRSFRLIEGRLEQYVTTGAITFEARDLVVPGPGGRRLLDDVTFSLQEKSLMAVVGPSGSGKSTLLGALSGLRPAAEGQVLYDGRNLYADYAELRNRIGFVPQEDILHRELPLRDALEYSGRLRFPADTSEAERAARIDEVLAELNLSHRADSPISRLSGGERKRTSVALELLTKPSLLFLDEPASGLDPGLARVLMRVLRDLADGGRTIIVVTHELTNLRLCDQVLVLAPGGVPAYVGRPQQAAASFDRDDLTDVFGDMSGETGRDWRTVEPERPAPQPGRPGVPPPPASLSPVVRQQGWFSQLRTLSARYLAVLAADRRNLGLLLLQAPVLGVLMLAALPAGELGKPPPPEVRLVSTAGLVLFVVLLGATWVGANNAIREIARELPVLKRERSVGLSLSAYVTSKVVVLAGLTVVQSAVLVAIATARQRGPDDAVLLGWALGELMVVVALAGVAAMALGLFVSAVAGSPERATSVLPMLLILQLVLSAGVVLPEIGDKPVLRQVGYLSSAQWGVSAAASTTDLNGLQLFDERLRSLRSVDAANAADAVAGLTEEAQPERRWEHSTRAWLTATGALVGLTLLSILGATLALRRYDPGR